MNFKPVPILSAMLLLACSPNAQTTQTAQNQPAITTNAECKNLHKVTDIDDLLYQMYTNIDSQCLFEMPTAELEKIWGVKIFEYDYTSVVQSYTYPQKNQINNLFTDGENEDFLKKFDKYQQDFPNVFFLKKSIRFKNNQSESVNKVIEFRFFGITKISNKLFNLLLKPNKIEYLSPLHERMEGNCSNKIKSFYQTNTSYIWFNKLNKNNLPMLNIQIRCNIENVNLIVFLNQLNFK